MDISQERNNLMEENSSYDDQKLSVRCVIEEDRDKKDFQFQDISELCSHVGYQDGKENEVFCLGNPQNKEAGQGVQQAEEEETQQKRHSLQSESHLHSQQPIRKRGRPKKTQELDQTSPELIHYRHFMGQEPDNSQKNQYNLRQKKKTQKTPKKSSIMTNQDQKNKNTQRQRLKSVKEKDQKKASHEKVEKITITDLNIMDKLLAILQGKSPLKIEIDLTVNFQLKK